ncbi:Gastrula zinc finger, partial [Paramuricea clavata]
MDGLKKFEFKKLLEKHHSGEDYHKLLDCLMKVRKVVDEMDGVRMPQLKSVVLRTCSRLGIDTAITDSKSKDIILQNEDTLFGKIYPVLGWEPHAGSNGCYDAKDEARDKEIKELKKKGEVSEKKLKALEKDNRKLKKEGEFNKKSLGVLRNDNRKLKRNIAAMRVGEEGIEVIGGTATPILHKTINYEKTGESDEGTIEKFTLGISKPDFGGQLDVSRKIVGDLLKSVLDRPVKFVETLVLKMVKGLLSKNTDVDLPMESETITVMNASEVEDAVRLSAERIIAKIESYQDRGSNWRVILVEKHEVDVVHFNPLVGSSFIELPAPLKSNMNGLINIENADDDECFRWCHVRHLRPGQRATKITRSDRKFAKTLNYNGIKFPVRIDDIPKIEKANELRITVIMLRGEKMFFPRYTSKFDYKDHMELLLMDDGEGNNHYVLVRDISMLLNSLSKTQHKRFFCLGCLNGFNSQERLDKHSGTCREFVIYADFESLLIPVDGKGECLRKTHDHEMCSYGFKRACYYDGKYDGEYKSYRGVGAISRSLSELLGEVEKCNGIIQSEFNKEVVMSVKDYDKLEKATECHICGGKFGESDKKVLDHCHVTSKFRGAAHNSCNLNHKLTGKIPVVFHNLRGYDGNFIMQGVKELGEKIEVIANNMQKYMSFTVGKQLVSIDSMQFMSSSLENLVSNLSDDRFKRMQCEWQGQELEMLLKKGVYPYEYMSCWEKFSEKSLPEKSAFYSSLYEEEVNDDDYLRACKVYEKFSCKNLGDYHDLYLKTDVLLLADVFEDFRRVCLESYKLDPAHYISAPGLSWDAMLKRTGVKLDLLSNVDMYQFIEKGMRGG